jgi:hypothetical protein
MIAFSLLKLYLCMGAKPSKSGEWIKESFTQINIKFRDSILPEINMNDGLTF